MESQRVQNLPIAELAHPASAGNMEGLVVVLVAYVFGDELFYSIDYSFVILRIGDIS